MAEGRVGLNSGLEVKWAVRLMLTRLSCRGVSRGDRERDYSRVYCSLPRQECVCRRSCVLRAWQFRERKRFWWLWGTYSSVGGGGESRSASAIFVGPQTLGVDAFMSQDKSNVFVS
ncbi:hypothetical protein P171DRAFT_281672 [Karstenula rhodostoma CBS 690.94]|uniref:Uncharacterized protein n=1 Tax=Karstenula rhodostoma CBS 690.94 TaxID=1392251 RepID=A0A9P4UD20_9PLEO|nr:hypothetical protein P171DRAFT_281672 [Karstenula rhodostoma CBS 690.94]